MTYSTNWDHVVHRAEQLMRRLQVFLAAQPVRFTLMPSHETNALDYFSPGRDAELQRFFADGPVRYVPPARVDSADVVILTAHGSDDSVPIWNLRRKLPREAIIVVWFWDNHLAQLTNLKTALAADFLFPSHAYIAHYLFNPVSVVAGSSALCSAQWTADEAREIIASCTGAPRIHKALVNYVDYEFSWRSPLLRELAARCSNAHVLLMPAQDRSRYFRKTRRERLLEWLRYKATVILPVDKDLSTRLFDALLAGQIPVVPSIIRDFDRVIPPQVQRELGIVRVDDLSLPAIQPAIDEALRRFDQMGTEGVERRQQFALRKHMLPNRMAEMMEILALIARQEVIVPDVRNPGFGLYLAEKSAGSGP
jgi:hypothetical protein